MDKYLVVKEFDTIVCNPDFKNDAYYKYLPEPVFNDLIDFIREYAAEEENADILELMRVGYKRNIGDTVTVKNYVGLIQMRNGYRIEILPKISFGKNDSDNGNVKTKRTFLKMLRSMKDFPGKVFNEAQLKADRMNLYELFISMYLKEVLQLVKHGIKSAYIGLEDNLRYYKGKLKVSEHIKNNTVHRERFYVSYDEFHPNRPENRLVKSTLIKLLGITSSTDNAKLIRQLLMSFESVDESFNHEKDFSKVSIDRSTRDYDMLMRWSKIFLMNKSFSTFTGKNNARALLFPMERVYESYVAKYMKKIMYPDGWNVSSQDTGYYLFKKPRNQFALRPDLVMKVRDRLIVLDTKWKRLIDNEWKNFGITQADMYQMYAYSKKYDTSEIWLLYPLNDEMRNHEDISFDSGDGTTVNVFFVDVERIEDSLNELREKLRMRNNGYDIDEKVNY